MWSFLYVEFITFVHIYTLSQYSFLYVHDTVIKMWTLTAPPSVIAPFSYMMNFLNKTWFKKPTFHNCCQILYIITFSLLHCKGAPLIGLWIAREPSDWPRIAQSLSQLERSQMMENNENNVIYRIRQQIWNVVFLNQVLFIKFII